MHLNHILTTPNLLLIFLAFPPHSEGQQEGINDFQSDSDTSMTDLWANQSAVSTPPETVYFHVGDHNNNTVKAWSELDPKIPTPPQDHSRYSAQNLRQLVQNYHDRSTTLDTRNEVYYTRERIGDNVWLNIERIAPFKMFVDWAYYMGKVTDTVFTNQPQVIQNTSTPCAPETAFQLEENFSPKDYPLKRFSSLNPKVTQWLKKNVNTSIDSICSRYRGLTCNPKTQMCECENKKGSIRYVSHTRGEQDKPGEYPDGCYVKPWRSCSHLSLDAGIPSEYKAFHGNPKNMKEFLLRMATPLPRQARCEKGTYCVNMILNTKHKPICWCNSRMYSKECFNIGGIPLYPKFLEIRKQFHSMIIPEGDKVTKCGLDKVTPQKLDAILDLMESGVERNFKNVLKLMREVVGRRVRFCDFRKGMACDPHKRVCAYKSGCGPGRILEDDGFLKECRVENGYPCPIIGLECVKGAECKDFGLGRHCHCIGRRYGDLCELDGGSFFGLTLQSRVSGFIGYHFANLQEMAHHLLLPVERIMTLGYGGKCSQGLDKFGMLIVSTMGGMRWVSLDTLDEVVKAVQYLVGMDEALCDYTRFLGCGSKGLCEPMIPDVMKYGVKKGNFFPVGWRVHLRLRPMARCVSPENLANIPAIYHDIIDVQCMPAYQCRQMDSKPRNKYCLCPIGYSGILCNQKIAQPTMTKNVQLFEAPDMLPVVKMLQKDKDGGKHIDIVHPLY